MRRAPRRRWTGLRDALHAEWTKLRTTPGGGWLALAAIVLTGGLSAAAAAAVTYDAGTSQDPAKISLTGIDLGQAVIAILAVLTISGEYKAIGIVLGLLYLFPIAAAAVTDPDWYRHLQQIGPMSAGLAIQATTNLRGLPISPWAGLGVLAAWAAAALLTGGLLLRLRDA
jgi:ABC-2 type transport system permease protein